MLARRIVPCLDIKAGRVVKGVRFVELADAGDPVQLARLYEARGADELVFLDITATVENRGAMLDVVRAVAAELTIPFAVGGGVKTADVLRAASARFGSQCVVLAIDARLDPERRRYEVAIDGGRTPTGRDAVAWAQEAERCGAGEILLTSIDRDGTKSGFDLALTRTVRDAVSVPVIASGGAGCAQHVADALRVTDGALVASIVTGRMNSAPSAILRARSIA